jgi:transposase
MGKERIIMSQKEMDRLSTLHKVMNKTMTQRGAGRVLDLSERQIRRIIQRIKRKGNKGILHRARGRISERKMPESKERKIVEILKQDKYKGFGPTMMAEQMGKREGMQVGREKLRQIMQTNGIAYERRRKNKGNIHQWRERKANRGEMIQADGSKHDWLEGRGDELVLMGYIDDASNDAYGRFYEYEGTYPAMDSFERYIRAKGIPKSIYIDRHSTYKTNREATVEESLKGEQAKTQFSRAMKELGVEVIHARSPQAKGRIERLFETLQDRLVKEMRLAGINDIEGANQFLEGYWARHNAQFAREPLGRDNLHRDIPKHIKLDEVFCIKDQRQIGNGYTVVLQNRLLLISKPSITMRKQRITVLEDFTGKIRLKYQGRDLEYQDVTERDLDARKKVITALKKEIRKAGVQGTIAPNHPWMQFIRMGKGMYYR